MLQNTNVSHYTAMEPSIRYSYVYICTHTRMMSVAYLPPIARRSPEPRNSPNAQTYIPPSTHSTQEASPHCHTHKHSRIQVTLVSEKKNSQRVVYVFAYRIEDKSSWKTQTLAIIRRWSKAYDIHTSIYAHTLEG